MMIVVYIRNKIISPSGYYRILQYLEAMGEQYILRELISYEYYKFCLKYKSKKYGYLGDVIMYILIYFRILYFLIVDNINPPGIVVVSREFLPRILMFPIGFFIKRIARYAKLIWDFDDHILDGKEISSKEFLILSQSSNHIVVTNAYLREIIIPKFWEKVILLPTTDGDMRGLDLERIKELRKETLRNCVKLVWVATAANLPNLMRVLPILDETAKEMRCIRGKQLYLLVISSKPVSYRAKKLVIKNIEWTHDRAIVEMSEAHIGIMPLIDSIYSRGKGGFKLIQYMATGLPVIASNVGFNKDVVSNQSGFLVEDNVDVTGWKDAVFGIANDENSYLQYSENAFFNWKMNFSFDKNMSVWKKLLSS